MIMWGGQQKTWIHYRRDIISADINTAIFLSGYLRHISIHKLHAANYEVADLQRYKLIKEPKKVNAALKERAAIPFVFFCSKN